MLDAPVTVRDRTASPETERLKIHTDSAASNATLSQLERTTGAHHTVRTMFDGDKPFTITESSNKSDAVEKEKGSSDNLHASDQDKKRDWTVAVNLSASFGNSTGTVDYQMKELAALAEKTKGEPGLRIIVQGIFPLTENTDGQGGSSQTLELQAASVTKPGSHPKNLELRRFEIVDGKVVPLPSTQSDGLAKDTQSLVALASKYNADHIALIQQAHGTGNLGQIGTAGHASVKELTDAIHNGLAEGGSKFQQLDLLDFDSCFMAEKGVGDACRSVAKYMVASEETEGNADDSAGGQNLPRAIQDLIANPKMDGKQLGDSLVAAAKQGADNYVTFRGTESGVQTLANIDLSQAPQYNQALDKLADNLGRRLTNPEQRQQIECAIQNAKRLGEPDDPLETHEEEKRDLSSFVRNIQDLVKCGKLQDTDGTLQKDIDQYLSAEKQYVLSNYGEKGAYENTGGLSAFLPSDKNLNLQQRAEKDNQLQSLASAVDPLKHGASELLGPNHERDRRQLQGTAQFLESVLHPLPQVAGQLSQLDHSIEELNSAKTEGEMTAAMASVKSSADKLLADKNVRDQLQEYSLKCLKSGHEFIVTEELRDETTSWQNFVRQIIATRPQEISTS
jgi:hypothetical protein